MGHFKINLRDVFFILRDQLDYGQLCTLEKYNDLDQKTLDMLVNEAVNFAGGVVDPLQELGENRGVNFENGRVSCPEEFRRAFRKYGRDGWTALARDLTYGGGGFPTMMRIVVNDIMYGACQAFNMAPSLSHGAAHLIESFATEELKAIFVPRMFDGTWSGTMALTEPDAGSNLADIQTTAIPLGDGRFKIKGTKIFISWGDHDLAENIIHLVLARIEGAPQGVKGITLFIVPKYKVNPDGSVGASNDVLCGGVEKKLGLHGSPTCVLNFGTGDNCEARLCGEENQGLAHMFQMMNQARINTGVSGMAIAATAYQNALAYARERVQGRDIAGRKAGGVPIIDHPDIRRMLLWMKAVTDGMRSLTYTTAFWADLADQHPDTERREHYRNLVDFVTPIVKAYCSEKGFRVCETAMQCLGGYGFCREYPIEQYLRDIKVLSLYEGTNGIQALDLMGRKVVMKDGALLDAFKNEIMDFCRNKTAHPSLREPMKALEKAADQAWNLAAKMRRRQKSDPLQWASYTYPALMCLGEIVVVWRLLDMAVKAREKIEQGGGPEDFYKGKINQASWYADTVLPLCVAEMTNCLRDGREIIDMPVSAF